ncbi:hypothetical protein CCYA_CCYA04G1307 [Cyanidiococcus yangmingshanensis]|nr:hypothetical protein CCYA_CCYA04G1307 [Cyanidiococcus yangmingshanensis]
MWARDPSKSWAEHYFLLVCPVAIGFLLIGIVATGWYRQLDRLGYTLVSLVMAAVCIVPPALSPGWPDRQRPWYERFVFKANAWNAVFGFIGNYFWTHYFYTLLGAEYTFPNWRLNNVPVSCFLATQPYFCFYHTLTTLVLRYGDRRRHWTRFERALVVVLLAYGTALAETVTIAAFPHYRFRDWHRMVLFGSAFYGLYFIVSFPMYYRLDEVDEMTRVPLKRDEKRLLSAPSRWTLGQVILDALAAAMIVTILLDVWRLVIGGIGKGLRAPTNPWMGVA